MPSDRGRMSRRGFLRGAATAASALAVVPRHVVGAESPQGPQPPSEVFPCGLIGCGGQAGEDLNSYIKHWGADFKVLAAADCHYGNLSRAKQRWGEQVELYTDWRRVVERKDIDVVSIATPPHWHALMCIAAAQAGKDILCEKPMTRFIAEGRAVVTAVKRYRRVFQIGTSGRFGACKSPHSRQIHKIMRSGLLGTNCQGVFIQKGGFPVKRYCGLVNAEPQPVPKELDWDMYCGPSPLRPFHRDRFGWNHRFYWDYEGGALADFAQHHMDPFQWIYGKDDTSPVEIESSAPPAHPECCTPWAWVELRYADGLTLVLDGNEWGPRYDRKPARQVQLSDLDAEAQKKLAELPDPEPLLTFPEAVRQRKESGGHVEAAHRAITIAHLANISIRLGRKIKYDPVKEEVIGDDVANRLVYQPMREPWHL